MEITSDMPRPLLNWVLRRGRHILSLQVRRTGAKYRVSVSSGDQRKSAHVDLFRGCPQAFLRHATLVAAFRAVGWTSVRYR